VAAAVSVLRLTTPTGSIVFRDAGAGRCSSCARHVDTTAEVFVHHGERELSIPHVCGSCVAQGMAIVFGRNHLEAGGRIGDLEVPPPEQRPWPPEEDVDDDGGPMDLDTLGPTGR
jgi:hypothetical protein